MSKIILLSCVWVIFLLLVIAALRAAFLVSVSLKIQKNTSSYSRVMPEAKTKVLFLGDSTALGTGAETPELTVAGRLAGDMPDASIENESRNGMKTRGLLENVRTREWSQRYSLIVIQIGGNDILRFSGRAELTTDIQALLAETKLHTDTLLLITAGDVGRAPFFPYLVGKIWNGQTRAVREIFMKAATQNDALYVDLYSANVDETFEKDIPKYYSDDRLHPRGEGYRIWYEELKATLESSSLPKFPVQ